MIDGVEIKTLVTHEDERGYFREIIRSTDPIFRDGFGQWSVSLMRRGVVKAWHLHKRQVDWWYVAAGRLCVALYDARTQSMTHGQLNGLPMGDDAPARVLRIPPGVAHGCKVLTDNALLVYVTSRVYDPKDELRWAPDDPRPGFDWTLA